MTPARSARRHLPRRAAGFVLGALPRAVTRLRRNPPPDPAASVGLVALAVAVAVGSVAFSQQWFTPSLQVLPLLGGGLLLRRRSMRRLLVVVAACLAYNLVVLGLRPVRPGALVSVVVTALIAYDFARSREETGLHGLRGDSVLVELRDRLEQQGELPELPQGWSAEAVLRPAGGGPFAGDFVVSTLSPGCERLEVALVDVSGKGVDAGTRALLLSGALGGLLGALPVGSFLAAANGYLCRQDWEEGFATAVHVAVDLVDGSYSVSSAGHPPVAVFDAGSGRWSLLEVGGLALGLLPDVEYDRETGQLDRGDALLFYTDGLVEVPGRDLSVGIDKLLGEAERLVPHGFTGGADLLVSRVAAGSSDDRGLVLLWRTR